MSNPTTTHATNTFVDRGKKVRPPIPDVFLSSGSASTSSNTSPTPTNDASGEPEHEPSIIPPEHQNRTLVVCFDGTGDHFDLDNSNIVQFVSLLKKDDKSKQMVYYQAGIGAYTSPNIASPLRSKIYKTLDEMVAWDLDAHVMDGYEFLMQNYKAGDRICLFGFSRGAYTARSLAGMIYKVGLLPADNWQQVPFAYKMYTRADEIGWKQSNAFKKAFSIDVGIEFVGVWDTVDSVGLIPKRLPFTTSNTIVRTFRHALALDERRAKFKANIWNRPNLDELKLGSKPHHESTATDPIPFISSDKLQHGVNHLTDNKDRKLDEFEFQYSETSKRAAVTDIEEVWFIGCHCGSYQVPFKDSQTALTPLLDVGGGSVNNATRHSLARISLRWMVRECFKTDTGIMFDAERLRAIGLDPSSLYPYVKTRPPPLAAGSQSFQEVPRVPSFMQRLSTFGSSLLFKPNTTSDTSPDRSDGGDDYHRVCSEEEEDLKDALSPVYDQLTLQPGWWLLEILPLNFRYQKGNNEWVSYTGFNLGRPRSIPNQDTSGIKVHRTVKSRMEASPLEGEKKYVPRSQFLVEPTWVD